MLTADEANRRYFRDAYRTGEHGWSAQEPSPYAVKFLNRLKRLVPGGALLDIGCGEGRHAIAAARLGFRVTAMDYEPLALKRARRLARTKRARGISFREGNVLSMPFPKASFDVVLDYGCLHHQRKSHWGSYRTSILRVLKPGGFYVLSVFSPRFHLFRGTGRRWHIAQGAYRRCFTSEDILGLFGRAFEILALAQEPGRGEFWHALMRRRR
jgi:SAM-dependent methyltransferase